MVPKCLSSQSRHVTMDYHITESMAVEDQTERIKKILDAKYSATSLEMVRLLKPVSPQTRETTEVVGSTKEVQRPIQWNLRKVE
jgi:hypothetical protein